MSNKSFICSCKKLNSAFELYLGISFFSSGFLLKWSKQEIINKRRHKIHSARKNISQLKTWLRKSFQRSSKFDHKFRTVILKSISRWMLLKTIFFENNPERLLLSWEDITIRQNKNMFILHFLPQSHVKEERIFDVFLKLHVL